MFINPKKVQAVLARCLIAGVALAVSPLLAASDKPNVVFMLSDNLGYGDLGVYGGGIIRGGHAAHRCARGTGHALYQLQCRGRVHTLALCADDRKVRCAIGNHPCGAVTRHPTGNGSLGIHHGRDVQRRGL